MLGDACVQSIVVAGTVDDWNVNEAHPAYQRAKFELAAAIAADTAGQHWGELITLLQKPQLSKADKVWILKHWDRGFLAGDVATEAEKQDWITVGGEKDRLHFSKDRSVKFANLGERQGFYNRIGKPLASTHTVKRLFPADENISGAGNPDAAMAALMGEEPPKTYCVRPVSSGPNQVSADEIKAHVDEAAWEASCAESDALVPNILDDAFWAVEANRLELLDLLPGVASVKDALIMLSGFKNANPLVGDWDAFVQKHAYGLEGCGQRNPHKAGGDPQDFKAVSAMIQGPLTIDGQKLAESLVIDGFPHPQLTKYKTWLQNWFSARPGVTDTHPMGAPTQVVMRNFLRWVNGSGTMRQGLQLKIKQDHSAGSLLWPVTHTCNGAIDFKTDGHLHTADVPNEPGMPPKQIKFKGEVVNHLLNDATEWERTFRRSTTCYLSIWAALAGLRPAKCPFPHT